MLLWLPGALTAAPPLKHKLCRPVTWQGAVAAAYAVTIIVAQLEIGQRFTGAILPVQVEERISAAAVAQAANV